MSISPTAWDTAVRAAARAPSPHNAQPARWNLRGDVVALLEDPAGWLCAADPAGRDSQIALGMAWESMSLALSLEGLRLEAPALAGVAYPPPSGAVRVVARGKITVGPAPDELARHQGARRSWRGGFRAAAPGERRALEDCLALHADVALAIPDTLRASIADWYDGATIAGLADTAVAAELYRWMRFSTRDPGWSRDGLSADCLGLGRVEARLASWLMRPRVLGLLSRAGLARLMVSEARKVASATIIVAIRAPLAEPPFVTGRRWYRFWLAATAAGFAGVPMSALADSPAHRAALMAVLPVGTGHQLVNIMRLGPAPTPPPPPSARRPPAELLVG